MNFVKFEYNKLFVQGVCLYLGCIESGVIGFSFSNVRLKSVILELAEQYLYVAENKGIEFILETDDVSENLVIKSRCQLVGSGSEHFFEQCLKIH